MKEQQSTPQQKYTAEKTAKIKYYYSQKINSLATEIKKLKQRNTIFIVAEIISFLSIIGFVALYTILEHWAVWALFAALLCLIVYIVIRMADTKNTDIINNLQQQHEAYIAEKNALEGDFSAFDTGIQYANVEHSYSTDIDIFGTDSLFNRINRTISEGGSYILAKMLTCLPADKHLSAEYINKRAEAIKEFTALTEWRMKFIALGKAKQGAIKTTQIMKALQKAQDINIPNNINKTYIKIFAVILSLGFLITLILSVTTTLSANIPTLWALINLALVMMLCAKYLSLIGTIMGNLNSQLKAYSRAISLVCNQRFYAEENINNQNVLKNAEEAFIKLEKILNRIDARANILAMILSNIVLLADIYLLINFMAWRKKYMCNIHKWIDTISKIDATISMANFAYNNPQTNYATIEDNKEIIYKATNIAHPFLGIKAVTNSIEFINHNFYIITGANMAGKSTFLRAVAINYVLAMCGMPVFASCLRVSIFSLFTGMRTSDNLTQGISYFNAELIRLKKLITYCKKNKETLIILDEILKGTNSLDKLNGSKLFLQAVSKLPVTGIIATHDLELSKMENNNKFHNYCFEIQLGENVSYTYKITKGIAKNQNATFLLNQILDETLKNT